MRAAHWIAVCGALSPLGCGARTALLEADDLGGPAGSSFGGAPTNAGNGGASAGTESAGTGAASGARGSLAGGGPGGGPSGGAAAGGGASGSGGAAVCQVTGSEECDGLDNDCNGQVDDGAACPCRSQRFGQRNYLFCEQVADWASARNLCAKVGYHLTSVRDASADRFLAQTAAGFANARWWMGLNDLQKEGRYVWVAGTPLSYVNWGNGEPNNQGNEDCGELNRFGPDGGWNDEPCDSALPFVCESGGP